MVIISWYITETPVSYTHLDVYKRQQMISHYRNILHNEVRDKPNTSELSLLGFFIFLFTCKGEWGMICLICKILSPKNVPEMPYDKVSTNNLLL